MSKTLNIVIMLVMAAFAIREGYDIVQHGANAVNVIFLLIFSAFAVRRFLLLSKYA
ncbi:MAG: hypothetical protein HYX28_08180 [Candidatus Koribacter versatilis]|uniref:Uncharacterized protein n=1 Tax=Candidatus Korobacter versatilis TaxID=658062 RepID=A0A932ERC9_9BACT|nr:hypothetical protein [Candidatus Koribacter versatilis]